MSDTPRTDAVWELFATDTTLEPDVEFSTLARQLERELNAANDRIKRLIRERDEARAERDEAAKVVEKALSELGQVARSRCALIDRIKRLERLVDGVHYVDGVHLEEVDGLNWFDARTAAKEDKL